MEEFEAAAFNALHGFYRQSIGCARNALEVMTVGSACHTLKHHNQFKAWQNGDKRFGFGAACDLLIGVKSLQELRKLLADKSHDSLFDQKAGDSDGGWIRRLYDKLSEYSHSRPGFTSGDLWRSNGPVYNTAAFRLCFDTQIETSAACFLLSKSRSLICESKPDLRIRPQAQNILFKDHSGAWLNVAAEAAKELGLITV